MTIKTGRNDSPRWAKWTVGSIGLLVISAALKMFVSCPPADTGAGTMILAALLAFWSSVLGVVGVSVSTLWWLVGRLGGRAKDAASVPSGSPKEGVDKNKPNRFTRVA